MTEKNGLVAVTDRRDLRAAPSGGGSVTPMDLLRIATSQGADLDRLEKLMDLEQRWRADEARRAFAAAMSAFKLDPPDILKNKHVDRGNAGTYNHATHDEVCSKVSAALAKHGLSHSWSQRQEDKNIYIRCRITHALGHFEESSEMFGPPDTSGSKSPLQAIASTVTFLQRYTLLAITGLSSREMRAADTDAAISAAAEPAPEGFENWQADMEALADEGDLNKLAASWGKSPPPFRRYTVKYREDWWNGLKERGKGAA